MAAKLSGSPNLLALALILCSLVSNHGQVQAEGQEQGSTVENVGKPPLEPLEVPKSGPTPASSGAVSITRGSSQSGPSSVAVPQSPQAFDSSSVGLATPRPEEKIVKKIFTSMPEVSGSRLAPSSSPSAVSSSNIQRVSSESLTTSTTSGPNQVTKTTSSHSVHVSSSAGDTNHEEHSFESSNNGNEHSPDYHESDDSHGSDVDDEGEEEEEEGQYDETPSASAYSSVSVLPTGTGDDEFHHHHHHHQPGWYQHQFQQQHHHSHDDDDDHDEEPQDNDEDEHTVEDQLHHRQYDQFRPSHHEETRGSAIRPIEPAVNSSPQPIERVDETYIDNSDPNDPKKVHYRKEVKAQVGPNGESYQHNESKTANSIGANPNSYSHHSSSTSSSYVTSHSGIGGGNYRRYEPYKQQPNRETKKVHENQRIHQEPYYNFNKNNNIYKPVQEEVKGIPSLPPLPGLPKIPKLQFPPMPQMPHSLESWVNNMAHHNTFPPQVANLYPPGGNVNRAGGHGPHYGTGNDDTGGEPNHSHRGRVNKNKRRSRLARLQSKVMEQFAQQRHDNLDDFV